MNTPNRLLCLFAAAQVLPASLALAQTYPPHGPHFSGVAEGTPVSTVSIASNDTVDMGALVTATEIEQSFDTPVSESAPAATQGATTSTGSSLDLDAGGGSGSVDGKDFDIYTLRVPYSLKLNDRGTLQFSAPLSVASYKDAVVSWDSAGLATFHNARAYGAGLNVGYAYKAVTKAESQNLRWKVTPSMGLFYRDCSDLNQGSWVYNMGLSSSLAWQLAPGWVLNLGNSLSVAWNNGIKDYPDPVRDTQETTSNGLQLYRLFERWTAYGYVMDTEALRDVLVDSYQSYGLGASYKLTKTRSVRATLIYEHGNASYHSLRVTLGTSWQF